MTRKDMNQISDALNAIGDVLAGLFARLAFGLAGLAILVGLYFAMRPVTHWLIQGARLIARHV